MIKLHRKLHEAVEVPDTELIGSNSRYDVFKINTWQAATAFRSIGSQVTAGEKYVHDEATFNKYINPQNYALYFFANINTNDVYAACLAKYNDENIDCTIQIENNAKQKFAVPSNVSVEVASTGGNYIQYNKRVPLYLIPNAIFGNDAMTVQEPNGAVVVDGNLVAVLPQFCEIEDNHDCFVDSRTDNFTRIAPNAFTFGKQVDHLVITSETECPGPKTNFDDVVQVHATFGEDDEYIQENWPENWVQNLHLTDKITYYYEVSDEIKNNRRAAAQRRADEKNAAELNEIMEAVLAEFNNVALADGELLTSNIVRDMRDCNKAIQEQSERVLNLVDLDLLGDFRNAYQGPFTDEIMNFREVLQKAVDEFQKLIEVDNLPDLTAEQIKSLSFPIETFENKAIADRLERIEALMQANPLIGCPEGKEEIAFAYDYEIIKNCLRQYKIAREEYIKAKIEARKLRYKAEGNEITILGTRSGIRRLAIPARIDGKLVTKIADHAFAENRELEVVLIENPHNFKVIGAYAFYNASCFIATPKVLDTLYIYAKEVLIDKDRSLGYYSGTSIVPTIDFPASCIIGKNAFTSYYPCTRIEAEVKKNNDHIIKLED